MKRIVFTALALLCAGCASNPSGSNWAVADFNKYGLNYAPFNVDRLQPGAPLAEIKALYPSATRIAAGPNSETYSVDRWESVQGPDYVAERLIMRFQNGRLAEWKIDSSGTVTVVPRSW